jgi:hypothetical protein
MKKVSKTTEKVIKHVPAKLSTPTVLTKRFRNGETREIDIRGLPQAVLDEWVLTERRRGSAWKEELLNIFKESPEPLSPNEIIIAWYRKTGDVLKRGNCNTRLSNLKKLNILQYTEDRLWALVKPNKEGKHEAL